LNEPFKNEGDYFTKRFVLVDDETMAFLWETATQIDTRIRINPETRTVAKGALWNEESLPPETLLIGLAEASKSRNQGTSLSASKVLDYALNGTAPLQFGGKATVGRGRCKLVRLVNAGV
jgi:CRISPR-associated protein Cmr4